MVVYIVRESLRFGGRAVKAEDVFVGNDDEFTPAEIGTLRARLAKVGYELIKRRCEPVKSLPEAVVGIEQQAADLSAALESLSEED